MTDRSPLDDRALDQLFREARTHGAWLDRPVSDELLIAAYDLAKMGPTSANSCPARFVFVRSKEAKEKLRPHLEEGNVGKTMAAPVTVIIAGYPQFYERLPQLYPQADARSWFANDPDGARETEFRNGTLQGAYFMLAARALGLDCGPMSGFDAPGVNKAFFPEGLWRANFLCNLGYGDSTKLKPRNPRLNFDEACRIV